MRKQDKIILWPVYFDSTKTRLEGRKVPRNLAVPSPKLDELQRAAERISLKPEVVVDAKHPSAPWQKTGMIIIPKKNSKNETIRRVARELIGVRE